MSMLGRLFIASALTLSIACATTGTTGGANTDIQTRTVTDKAFDFEGVKSFSWRNLVEVMKDPDGTWAPRDVDLMQEVRFLLEEKFRGLGWATTEENPDVAVILGMGVDMNAMLKIKENLEGDVEIEKIPKAAFVIQVTKGGTDSVVWAGFATGTVLENPTREQTQSRLKHGVEKLFEKFPN